jgi:hypothetical protein
MIPAHATSSLNAFVPAAPALANPSASALPAGRSCTAPAGLPHVIATRKDVLVQINCTEPTPVHYAEAARQ